MEGLTLTRHPHDHKESLSRGFLDRAHADVMAVLGASMQSFEQIDMHDLRSLRKGNIITGGIPERHRIGELFQVISCDGKFLYLQRIKRTNGQLSETRYFTLIDTVASEYAVFEVGKVNKRTPAFTFIPDHNFLYLHEG